MAKMSNKKFISIWTPFLVLAAAAVVAVEVVTPNVATILDTYVNRGNMIITPKKGTENWNTNYYDQTYATASGTGASAETLTAGQNLVEEIANEGMVLLKNDGTLPLSNKNIALIGRGAVDPIYGGSGSGNVDTTKCATPKSGLEKAGFTVNVDAYNFFNTNYKDYDRQNIKMDNYDQSTFFVGEIPTSKYTFTPVKSETAVVFISRAGGEGLDLSSNLKRDSAATSESQKLISSNANTAAEVANYTDDQHQLELSKEEKNMISWAETNYSKVVVVLNNSTTMEIGDLKNDDKISGIIWAGSPGVTGFNALGSILAGTVNPSGKTPDLYSADFTADPTFKNFAINGVNEYTGNYEDTIAAGVNGTKKAHFVDYEEGIYVGYRYYETAAEAGYIDYSTAVVYPFGYGLSYTTFTKEIVSSSTSGDDVTIKVKVTNSGTVAGKEVVQAYYTAPYTSGGIEKASTVLGDFTKTKLLQPNESEEVTVTIAKEDMASYDYKTEKAYVLDAGTYKVQIKDDSHTIAKDTSGKTLEVSFDMNKQVFTKGRKSDDQAATNQFDDVSAYFTEGHATTLSRSSFSTTFPTSPTADEANADTVTVQGHTITELLKKYVATTNDKDEMPTMNEKNGLGTIDLRGKDWDDEQYDKILNQLTEDDYSKVNDYLVNGAYNTPMIYSLSKPATEDHDGPQGFSSLMGSINNAVAYTSEPLIAATFNKELGKKMGTAIGEEALAMNPRYSGWYGPAMNTHRSPFAGRNFEYYSEDGVLAGKMAAEVVSGAADKGLYAYIKHFALNDQETWRTAAVCTWADEQTIREIYLKPFEIVVKTAETEIKYIADTEGTIATKKMKASTAVMSSFNRIGTTWAGGSYNLMTEVLRNEWGFRGFALSDFNLYTYMDAYQGMTAGTDMQLTWTAWAQDRIITDTKSATSRKAIRNALHNVLYTVANSNAMQGFAPGTTFSYTISPWRVWLICLDVALGLFVGAGTGWVVYRTMKFSKKEEEKTQN